MKRVKMTAFSIRYPWLIIALAVAMTMAFGNQFPNVMFDNDPENMLADDEPIRVFHNQVKARYNLYEFVIVGIVNEVHEDGVFNVETLSRIDTLTNELISLQQNDAGLPTVLRDGERWSPALESTSAWQRTMAGVFGNDVHDLFAEDGSSAIIAAEIISPSVVDNIKQADHGQLAIEFLMEEAPTTREQALVIGHDALNNPLYRGTLVAEDGKAIAIYLPLIAKTYSYNVANLVEKLTEHWDGDDQVFITGQPVAQDTFGVEMLVQMASSAPMAGLAIFILLFLFFRRVSLIIAPMLVAIISVVVTMGLLIGLGYKVHIMSSMIAIFLMPISVADSVHVLSEFFDTYHKFRDKAKTIKHVVGHLFMPMLYTTLTTMAGFAALATTPIPPVQIFGLHVAFGVGLAWLLTMTLVPAYIMIFVPAKDLDSVCHVAEVDAGETIAPSRMLRMLHWIGSFSYLKWRLILALTLGVVAISAFGISKIKVNDNPIKWFTENHRIRVADRVLNSHFSGTYTAYLTLRADKSDGELAAAELDQLRATAAKRFGVIMPDASQGFIATIDAARTKMRSRNDFGAPEFFRELSAAAATLDRKVLGGWNDLGDEINYLDPSGLTYNSLIRALAGFGDTVTRQMFIGRMSEHSGLIGEDLQNTALDIVDEFTALSFSDFVVTMRAQADAPAFKKPEVLAYIADFQAYMADLPNLGKSSSAVDALMKANYELNFDASESAERNDVFYSVPPTTSAVTQVFIQLEGMKKKDSLFHLITKDYNELNIWVQLQSGDNTDMQLVVDAVDTWMEANPAPVTLHRGWAGLTYINVVWQEKMVAGMLKSLMGSFVVVLIMMMVLFRSVLYGFLAIIPLTVTITFIYGIIGLIGKDYDMPVAILSSLTLGLSVDFAIHFLQRSRELSAKYGSWRLAIPHMFEEPAMAISRNAIIISIGFTPLLFAPLVPYKTVGFFLATIMAVSWLSTLFILAALITALQKKLMQAPAINESDPS